MAGRAAHHDLIGLPRDTHIRVPRQAVPQALVGIKPRARLIKDGDLQIGAVADLSGIGGNFAQQHLDDRGLAHAVRPHKRHPVAALHAQVEIC